MAEDKTAPPKISPASEWDLDIEVSKCVYQVPKGSRPLLGGGFFHAPGQFTCIRGFKRQGRKQLSPRLWWLHSLREIIISSLSTSFLPFTIANVQPLLVFTFTLKPLPFTWKLAHLLCK